MSQSWELRAGPVRLKLEDGELRYLTVGTSEIVRRVFVAVRTKTWDTASPRFEVLKVEPQKDSFRVVLKARCTGRGGVDYTWDGEISGDASGKIVYKISGAPNIDMESNRIGICVLFGTPTVCGSPYEVITKAGTKKKSHFPHNVNAPLTFEPDFTSISTEGAEVSLNGSPGTLFSMEDQRNFADSSFKAYAPLPYAYPKCKKSERFEETVTIEASFTGPPAKKHGGNILRFDSSGPAGRLPQIRQGDSGERIWFYNVNHEREKFQNSPSTAFAYFPVEHLFDDDTCWENVPVIIELAEAARAIFPEKPIDIHRIALDATAPRPARDPRNASPFGAAWSAACLKYAALASIRSATFALGPGHAKRLLERLSVWSGQPVRGGTVLSDALTRPVDGFQVGEAFVVWNKTQTRQRVRWEGLPGGVTLRGEAFDGLTAPSAPPRTESGGRVLTLNPLEVRILTRR